MINKRFGSLMAVAVVVLAACSSSGSSPAASAGSGRLGRRDRLHGRRVVEQLPAAALGGP